jgi:hypothetical protein
LSPTDWEIFKFQAIKAVGLEGHPNAEAAYQLAWKNGHEGGKDEVLVHLWDIAESILEGE